MSKVLIEEQTLYDIGDAIRVKNGQSTTYKPGEAASAIRNIPNGDVYTADILLGVSTFGSVTAANETAIRTYAAWGNTTLTGITAEHVADIQKEAFAGCTSLSEVSFPECTTIGSGAFSGCRSLSAAVSFPACTTIGPYAFAGCTSLSEASFPECTTIGSSAFAGCTSLSEVSFPECTTIGLCAFNGCTSLSEVSFPACTTIGLCAFAGGCTSLSVASFPACTTVGSSAFNECTSLSAVSFPACTTISGNAFRLGCFSVLSFPNLLQIKGDDAFGRCYNLTEFYAPELSVISGITVFYYTGQSASSTISLNFPKLTRVNDRVFDTFVGLETIRLVACSYIGFSAFARASRLMSLYLLSTSVASLTNTNAFASTPIANSSYTGSFGSIFVPSELVDSYKSATNWSTYADRITAYTGE